MHAPEKHANTSHMGIREDTKVYTQRSCHRPTPKDTLHVRPTRHLEDCPKGDPQEPPMHNTCHHIGNHIGAL
eukprot:6856485-Pyramimonas_sp.AAC.1